VFVNTLGIVALAFTTNWGPENQVITLESFSDYLKFYGDGGASDTPAVYTSGYKANNWCFQGEGLPGKGGAGTVLAYRMVGSGGVNSTLVLQNTAPAAAITLTAKYKGSYGNKIAVTVVADARNPATQLDLNIYVDGFLTETYVFNKTDITGLAAQINTSSQWVSAGSVTSGTALATVATATSLAGGNDGSTLTGTDFTNMQNAFGVQRFGVFAVEDIAGTASWNDGTGSAVLTALLSWQQGLNTNGKRFMTVIGGSIADTSATATTRAALANDPNVINIGIGNFQDPILGQHSTSQLAPRLAGIIASRQDKMSLTFSRLAGITINTGASDSDILAGIQGGGYMTVARDSNAAAPVRFDKAMTTYATATPSRPLWAFSKPKFVITMQDIENTIAEWADANVIGQIPVDTAGINWVLGQIKGFMKQFEGDRVIQPGWTITRSPTPAPTPQDDFVAVQYGVSFMRDMEQVLNTVIVS
jgi:hypothetical protein